MWFRNNQKYALLTLCVPCLLILSACAAMEMQTIPLPAEKPEVELKAPPEAGVREDILGKWRRSQSGDMIEFLRDGTVKFYSPIENAVYPGTYHVDDEKHITTSVEQGGDITWGFVVSKSELQLTAPSGLVLKYRKVE